MPGAKRSTQKLANGLTVQMDKCARYIGRGMDKNEAGIKAGYTVRSAAGTVSRLLKKPEFNAVIEAVARNAADRVDLTAAFVLNGLMKNAKDGQEPFPVTTQFGEVVGYKPTDLKASNGAYGLLGKHLRLFIDRTSIEMGDSATAFLNDVADIINEEVEDPETRGRVVARLVLLVGATPAGTDD